MVMVPFTAHDVAQPRDARPQQLSQFGRALTGLGGEVVAGASEWQARIDREAEETQKRIDIAAVREIDSLGADGDREVLLGFTSSIGKEAVDGYAGLPDDFDQRTKEMAGKLKTDAQREAFMGKRLARREQFLDRATSHWSTQSRRYDDAQTKARVDNLAADAVAYYDPDEEPQDPQRPGIIGPPRATNADRVRSAVAEARALAGKRGLDSDSTAQLVKDTTTTIHSGNVEQLIVGGRLEDAAGYLSSNRGAINPETATKLQDKIQSGIATRDKVTAKSLTDDAAAKLVLSLEGQTLTAKLEAIQQGYRDGDYNVEVRNAAIDEAESEEASRRRRFDDEKDATIDAVSQSWVKAFDAKQLSFDSSWQNAFALLPASVRVGIEDGLLMADVAKAWGDVKRERFLDDTSMNPDLVITSRNFEAVDKINLAIEGWKTRLYQISGDEAKTEAGAKKKKLLEKRILEAEQIGEGMSSRVYEDALHVIPRSPAYGGQRALPEPDALPDPEKARAARKARQEEQRRRLYGERK